MGGAAAIDDWPPTEGQPTPGRRPSPGRRPPPGGRPSPKGRVVKRRAPRRRKALRRRSGGRWAGPLSALMLMVMCALGVLCYAQWNQYTVFTAMRETVDRATFYPGVVIEGVDVSGKTPEEAMAMWAQREARHQERYDLTLRSGNTTWTLNSEKAGYHSDMQSVLARAYALGRSGTFEQRYASIAQLAQNPRELEISRGHEDANLRAFAGDIAKQLTKPGSSATVKSFDLKTNKAVYAEGKPGYVADSGEIYGDLLSRLSGQSQGDIEVRVSQTVPALSAAELAKSFGKVAGATTGAGGSSANRVGNIKLALAALNGQRIDPGESLSFNQTTGERTTKKGYREAGAIRNGRMVAEPGGGVCQVSTTLFNAVAKADMTIVKRQPHSRPSTYVDIGKDAQVNWPDQDFVFKNETDMPAFLVAYYEGGNVCVDVYGKKLEDGISITITSKQTASWSGGKATRITNKSLKAGQTRQIEGARSGRRATTYRNYVKNDKVIRSEVLCESTYPASGGIVEVGPGKSSGSGSKGDNKSSGKKPRG